MTDGPGGLTELPWAVLDEAVLSELWALFEGRRAAVEELVELFVSSAGRQLVELVAAIQRGEPGAAAATVHRLKGSSASVGAQRVARLCARLEEPGVVEDPATRAAVVEALRREVAAATSQLQVRVFG